MERLWHCPPARGTTKTTVTTASSKAVGHATVLQDTFGAFRESKAFCDHTFPRFVPTMYQSFMLFGGIAEQVSRVSLPLSPWERL